MERSHVEAWNEGLSGAQSNTHSARQGRVETKRPTLPKFTFVIRLLEASNQKRQR